MGGDNEPRNTTSTAHRRRRPPGPAVTFDPATNAQLLALLRVALAGLLGALIGYERQRDLKPARIPDYALVSVGACLFTVAGLLFGNGDAGKFAVNVVSGIGFLGAGVIMRHGGTIHGVTTAASIWAVAAIGIIVGLELYLLAIGTAVGLFALLRVTHSKDTPER